MLGLNTLLQRLNGSAADPLALGAELVEIKRQRAALPGKRADLKLRRLEALRNDDDKEARNIERQLADLDRDEDRLADSEIHVGEQARAAQAIADERAADDAVARYLELSEDTANKVEAADASAAVQRLAWDKNQGVLGRCGIEPLGCMLILGSGFGVQWALRTRQAVGRMRAIREMHRAARERHASGQPPQAPKKTPLPAPAAQATGARARSPHERPRMTDSARQVTLAFPNGSAPQRRAAQPPDHEPLTPGQVRLVTVRSGLEVAGQQYRAGQTFRADIPVADKLLRAGSVELVERFNTPAPNAATPSTPASVPADEGPS